MLTFGFEKEYFVKNRKEYVICPKEIPMDECGFLAEARGDTHTDVVKAAYLLLAEEYKLAALAQKHGVVLKDISTAELPLQLQRDALRQFGKPTYSVSRGNIYGIDYPVDDKVIRAGLHIHFSNDKTFDHKDGVFKYKGVLNIPKLIQLLDKEFEKEIKDSNRLPGFYEMKPYGFEYRSLPNSVNVLDVADVIKARKGGMEW